MSAPGWPRRYPIAQPPNAAALGMALAAIARARLEGEAAHEAGTAYLAAAAIWSTDELLRGANLFRRLLGLAVLARSSAGLRRRLLGNG